MHHMHLTVNSKSAPHAFANEHGDMHYAGMKLATIRSDKGLSQRDLAEMIGVNQSTIQRAEAGHPSAKLSTFKSCAEKLDVTLSEIFADDRARAEIALVRAFRGMPEHLQDRALAILEVIQKEGDQTREETAETDRH